MSDPAPAFDGVSADGPEPLLQHTYGLGQPWRVVAISMLLCRTRGDVAEPVIAEMLRRWPTAAAVRDAGPTLEKLLAPLGLSNQRAGRLRDVGELFARDPRPRANRVALLRGVGPYVLDAYRIVALGDLTVEPEDRALRRWLSEVVPSGQSGSRNSRA